MFKDFALFIVTVILIVENETGSTRNTPTRKRVVKLLHSKSTGKIVRANLTKRNDPINDNSRKIIRKTRTPQYFTLTQPNGIRLSPFALSYTPRFTGSAGASSGLTLQQMQQLQQLQQMQQLRQLGQLRSFVPQQRLNTALSTSPNLTPDQLELARVLPLLNLYRAKSVLKGNPVGYGAGVPLIQPNRLKYDSIPLKPGLGGQALSDNRLGLLLGLGGIGANPYSTPGTVGGSESSDVTDEGKQVNDSF